MAASITTAWSSKSRLSVASCRIETASEWLTQTLSGGKSQQQESVAGSRRFLLLPTRNLLCVGARAGSELAACNGAGRTGGHGRYPCRRSVALHKHRHHRPFRLLHG